MERSERAEQAQPVAISGKSPDDRNSAAREGSGDRAGLPERSIVVLKLDRIRVGKLPGQRVVGPRRASRGGRRIGPNGGRRALTQWRTASASSTTVGPVLSEKRSRTPDKTSRSRAAIASSAESNSTWMNTSFGSSVLRKSRYPVA